MARTKHIELLPPTSVGVHRNFKCERYEVTMGTVVRDGPKGIVGRTALTSMTIAEAVVLKEHLETYIAKARGYEQVGKL